MSDTIWEVYTIGGGSYLFDIFNAVAVMTSEGGYMGAIKISALFALMWILFEMAFKQQFVSGIRWFMTYIIIFNIMFVPKVTISIVDELRPLVANSVANVPFALGVFASLSSSVGHSMTNLAEKNFSDVKDFTYHKYGMLFGSKLVDISQRIRITDSNFAENINEFMKQCVFYDILLHRYTLEEIKVVPNIWDFLTEDGRLSVARMFSYYDPTKQQRTIVTCKDGAGDLSKLWGDQIVKADTIFSSVFGKNRKTETQTQSLLLSYLPQAYEDIVGVSASASDILKQNMVIHAFEEAAEDFTGIHGVGSFAAARADAQAKESYLATKRQAEQWVPLLRVVLECLYYGMFPFVFLLMLLPMGVQIMRGYFTTFVWLQSWGPLYAILNRIMVGEAIEKTSFISRLPDGKTGLALVNQMSIGAVQHDIALLAGQLSIAIPVIAAGLAAGAHRAVGVATSALAVPQSAASQASQEASTGNIQMGNISMHNQSLHNVSSDKWNTSPMVDTGRMQTSTSSGGMITQNSDGSTVINQAGAMSNLPDLKLRFSESQSSSLQESANRNYTTGVQFSKQASDSRASGYDQVLQHLDATNQTLNQGDEWRKGISTQHQQSLKVAEQAIDSFSQSHNLNRSTSASLFAGILGGISFGAMKGDLKLGLGTSTDAKVAYDDAKKIVQSKEFQDVKNFSEDIGKHSSFQMTNSQGHSLNDTISSSFAQASRLEEQSRAHFEKSESLGNSAQYIQQNAASIDKDMIQKFVNWGMQQRDLSGNTLGDRFIQIVTSSKSQDGETKERMLGQFVKETMPSFQQQYSENQERIGVQDTTNAYLANRSTVEDPTLSHGKRENQVKERFYDEAPHIPISNTGLIGESSKEVRQLQEEIANRNMDKKHIQEKVQTKHNDSLGLKGAKWIDKKLD